MKKLTLVQAACLLACGASLSTAQSQSGLQGIPEIIVTASRSEQDLQTAPVGATIITRAQIESAGVVDANEAIRKIGGVVAHGDLYGGREYTLDLRGFGGTSNENTVVLIDGIRISENEIGVPARLTGVSANSIERIEILRGGSGVMWGEGATAGIINIITRKDVKVGVSGQVGLGIESYGGVDGTANLRVGTTSGMGVFDLNARSSSFNGYRDNHKATQDISGLGYAYSDGALSFRTRLNHEVSHANYPGYLTQTQMQANPRQFVLTQGSGYQSIHQTRFTTGLDYKSNDWTASIDFGVKNRNVLSAFYSWPSSTTSTNVAQISPRAVYKGAVGRIALSTHVGADVHLWNYTNDAFSPTRVGTQSNRAVFAMTDWLLPTQTRVVAGYRLENMVKSYQATATAPVGLNNQMHAGELSINQTIQKGVDVYARLATSYRVANIDEYSFTNPSVPLLPQTSNDKEVGVKLKQSSVTFTARYFLQNTTNEISYDPNANGPGSTYGFNGANINLAPTQRKGIELQASAVLSPRVTLVGHLQSMKASFVGGAYAGNQIPLVSNQTASARAIYQLDEKQSIETAFRLLSPQYFGGDISNNCGSQILGSHMFDALYRYKIGAYDVSMSVNNFTNVLSYTATGNSCGTSSALLAYYPEAGRTFRAALKYNF
ncbi:MAG: TonB-dependent receptor [Cytophagales bacterium]|nr:TonB-dependent receptor [Cytophagales bacterium]